ncbi:SMP-30/gluconolactonase/LRE family protein [Salinisphaera aquimarina]|uniref:SMP-30/gluconolactonase/LRE family protein n=1 Tax=Salinisphaera aquimarina TaxID=2094031 RepID=A0ABV7EPE0_9GAMM
MTQTNIFAGTRTGLLAALLLIALCAASGSALAGDDSPVADGAKLRLVSDQFEFTEGPAADRNGNVFFTDQPNNRIWEYDTDGKLSLFMDGAGRSNGLFFDADGNLVSAADLHGELWSIGPDKQVSVLVKDYQGHRLNGPNDLWIDPRGGIYFTDPYYQRDYWTRTQPDIDQQRVYYRTPDGLRVIAVASDLEKPNGIIGTPDGKTLYISDFGGKKTYRYTIDDDGQLSDKTLFTAMGSDGMTMDANHNLYLTGHGVTIFNQGGDKIGHIAVDEEWTGNVTFGGADDRTLFITASDSLYTLRMNVRGASAP